MKLMISTAAAVTALGLAAGSASAQNAVLVPHRGHYHVVPSYSPPVYGGYAYPTYSPGVTFGSAYSPGVSGGGFYPSPGYGSGFYAPAPAFGAYGYGWSGHHHHHHHGHRHHHGHHHR